MEDSLDLLDAPPRPALRARGARLLQLPVAADENGALLWAQAGTHLPFEPRRFFCVYGVPPGEMRGRHAHVRQQQVLVCLRGMCTVTLDDGAATDEVVLDAPDRALYIPPLTWATQRYAPDTVLAVLASEVYRPEDYIRDYAAFRALRAAQA